MNARMLSLIAIAMFFGLWSGCASVSHGPWETIEAVSEPAGADVSITCQGRRAAAGVTPAHLLIRRKLDGCVAEFSKEGYVSARTMAERGFSRAYWTNVGLAAGFPLSLTTLFITGSEPLAAGLLGAGIAGAVGLIYDRFNGAMYDHPSRLSIRLQPAAMERHE